jgi:hypothetical protein
VFSLWNFVLSIKLIYLELLSSHFIRPVESAELPNVARVSKSLETRALNQGTKFIKIAAFVYSRDTSYKWRVHINAAQFEVVISITYSPESKNERLM